MEERESLLLEDKVMWLWVAFHGCMVVFLALVGATFDSAGYPVGTYFYPVAGLYLGLSVLFAKNPPIWLCWAASTIWATAMFWLLAPVGQHFGFPYNSLISGAGIVLGGACTALKAVYIFKRQQ